VTADGAISRDQVSGCVAKACPSFEKSDLWAEYWKHYGDEPEPQNFTFITAFVRHVIELKATGRAEELPATFDLIEDFIVRGDSYVHNLAIVGFLEDLQNDNLHTGGTTHQTFEEYLHPYSKWWWEELNWFWAAKGSLGSSGRPRPSGMPDPRTDPRLRSPAWA
jgi:hypothetical protein